VQSLNNNKTITNEPAFKIGPVPVYGDVVLAPMAGYSDMPFRSICRKLGSAMSYTEFVSTEGILHGNEKGLRMLRYAETERPITFQVFGRNPQTILEAAKRIEGLGPDIIDLNMGCSVSKVAGKGAGAALLKDPVKIGKIFALLSQHLTVPVTGKIRLGWDFQNMNYLEVVRAMEENGAQLVAVHGRTKSQAYKGNANWDAIGDLKSRANIPIIGNGDIKCVPDIARMKEHTGCDAVMVARAAIGNPWIFAGKEATDVPFDVKIALMRQHFQANLSFYGEHKGLILFRKHVAKYIFSVPGAKTIRLKLLTATTIDDFELLLEEVEKNEQEGLITMS